MRRLAGPHCALVALALVATWPGAGAARASRAPSAADVRYGAALPRFARFGWVSPPRESTTVARYAELAGAGFDLALPAWDDSGTVADNLLRLDCIRPAGARCLLLDNDLDSVSLENPASLALADTLVARYRDDPAFLGYYLGDEPAAADFPRLGELFAILRARDPEHPAWNSLRARWMFDSLAAFTDHVRAYVEATDPAVLCNNQYDFKLTGDSGLLTENIAVLGAAARERGIPFWGVVQLVEHWIYRDVTPGMLRWQVGQWLAGGARGIGIFTYWTPDPVSGGGWQPAMIEWGSGARTPAYDSVAVMNARLAPLGNTLAGTGWRAIAHAGSVPPGGVPFAADSLLLAVEGRATIGSFTDSTGADCRLLVNADSLELRTITLVLAPGATAARLRDDGSGWDALAIGSDGRLARPLAPGDYELLRLAPPGAPVGVGAGVAHEPLELRIANSPARGAVRLGWQGVRGRARIEVLDVSGRVRWACAAESARGQVTWGGDGAGGTRVPAGVYFVRLRDDHREVARRVVWLGR